LIALTQFVVLCFDYCQWRNDRVAAAPCDGKPSVVRGPLGRKKAIMNLRGVRPEKVTGAQDGCVTPLNSVFIWLT